MAGTRQDICDVVIVPANVRAYRLYLKYSLYTCQVGRTFQPGVDRLGFYAHGEIKREFPRILARRDKVAPTQQAVRDLRSSGDALAAEFANALERLIADRCLSEVQQVVLLSHPDAAETLTIPHPIRRDQFDASGRRLAWVQNQRYVFEAVLLAGPRTTSVLDDWMDNGIR